MPAVIAPPTISELEAKRDNVLGLLSKVEKQVGDLESKYVRSANPLGTAVTGYEGFLTGLAVPEQDMHIFSRSSVTAPQPKNAPPEVPAVSAAAVAEAPAVSASAIAAQPTAQVVDATAMKVVLTHQPADKSEPTAPPHTTATTGSDSAAAPAVTSPPPQSTTALPPASAT